MDGVAFDPWQFYAISDSECLTRYNITPRLGPPTYKSDTEVICTSYYSRLNPLEHGEVRQSVCLSVYISTVYLCVCPYSLSRQNKNPLEQEKVKQVVCFCTCLTMYLSICPLPLSQSLTDFVSDFSLPLPV